MTTKFEVNSNLNNKIRKNNTKSHLKLLGEQKFSLGILGETKISKIQRRLYQKNNKNETYGLEKEGIQRKGAAERSWRRGAVAVSLSLPLLALLVALQEFYQFPPIHVKLSAHQNLLDKFDCSLPTERTLDFVSWLILREFDQKGSNWTSGILVRKRHKIFCSLSNKSQNLIPQRTQK